MIKKAPTEYEIRSFLDRSQYDSLREALDRECGVAKPERQVTFYLESPVDTRIQLTREVCRLWQKEGRLHDHARVEREVLLPTDRFESLFDILLAMCRRVLAGWYRTRRVYQLGEFRICLDHTLEYGSIIEVEVVADSSEGYLNSMREVLSRLGVEETPREAFDRAYRDYLARWYELREILPAARVWVNETVHAAHPSTVGEDTVPA